MLADFVSGTSELCCHIRVCISLFPLPPPAHSALSCCAPSLIVVVTSDKMPPTKQMFSATSSLFSPSTACPKAPLLHPNDQADGKYGILYSAQSSTRLLLFLPRESHKSQTASFLFALYRNSTTDNFTIFSPKLLSDWHIPHSYPLPLYSPHLFPLLFMLLGQNASCLCFSFEELSFATPPTLSNSWWGSVHGNTFLSSSSTQKTNSASFSVPITLRSTSVHETCLPCNLLLISSDAQLPAQGQLKAKLPILPASSTFFHDYWAQDHYTAFHHFSTNTAQDAVFGMTSMVTSMACHHQHEGKRNIRHSAPEQDKGALYQEVWRTLPRADKSMSPASCR